MKSLVFILVLSLAAFASADEFAVLVAGSNTYGNYRHQADACHAYHILIDHGYNPDNIILMAYDDIANSPENPFPGKIFNKPSDGPGVDVYAGCKINYKGEDVTPENYLAIIQGKADQVHGGDGKVLKSTENDTVFLNFADHGAPGLIAFPYGELYASDLLDAFKYMHDQKMYKKLTYYLESCESGSMFQDLSSDISIYAVSAASPDESSWGTYCPPDDMVDGKELDSCLGDLFSVNWMEDSDAADTSKETLQQQWETVKQKTDKSQVMQWGDLTFTSDVIGEFLGMKNSQKSLWDQMNEWFDQEVSEPRTSVESRQITLQYLIRKYKKNPSSRNFEELQNELNKISKFDNVFEKFNETFELTGVIEGIKTDFDCYKQLVNDLQERCGRLDDLSRGKLKNFYEYCHYHYYSEWLSLNVHSDFFEGIC